MNTRLAEQVTKLRGMKMDRLQSYYGDVFGEVTRSTHRDHLVRRIAWKLQALSEGDLPDHAVERALQIADDADVRGETRFRLSESGSAVKKRNRRKVDVRLPTPGTELSRSYRDRTIVVKTLTRGFEYDNVQYGSLSAVARAVTGTRWNGLVFFGLAKRGETAGSSGKGKRAARNPKMTPEVNCAA